MSPTASWTSPSRTAAIPLEISGVVGVSATGSLHQDPSDPQSGYLTGVVLPVDGGWTSH